MADRPPKAADRSRDAAATPFPGRRVKPARERLLEAMLAACGELGYEKTTVQDAIERARTSRATFYKHFADKEDCFAQAYDAAGEWLYARLVGAAGRRPGWRQGLRAAIAELLEICANQPQVAKALIVEPHAAGGRALEQHNRLLQRLADALDAAPREPSARPGPPAVTSSFMVGAIEALLRTKLMAGEAERVPEMLPGLLYFAVVQYYGEEAAWEEMSAAPVAQWSARREAASEMP